MPHSVACRAISAFDSIQNASIDAWLLYPSATAAQPVRFGPYTLDLALDGAVAEGCVSLPLVALSHGNGSTPWVHRGLALHLAQAGFAVLLILHPGNNRNDNSLGFSGGQGRVKNVLLEHRPRHVKLAVDSALADSVVGPKLGDSYAVIGESIGAYTALAVAGAQATSLPDDFDMSRVASLSWDELRPLALRIPRQPDARVRAAVLFSPAIAFFRPDDALTAVQVPVLLRTGSEDKLCPPADVLFCLRSLPRQEQLQALEVLNAGHFSFQTPPPPELAHLPNAQDPAGFDRAAYQVTLKRDVTEFLQRAFQR